MYSLSYAETMDEICSDDRANEVTALNIVLSKLEQAHIAGMNSPELVDALFYTRRLWMFFTDNLADDANALPPEMRANLLSIGIWVIKEIERIRQDEVSSVEDLIQINTMIRDGLAQSTVPAAAEALEPAGGDEHLEAAHEDRT